MKQNTQKKILMVCEAFGGGVFAYLTQLCNDMADHFEVFLAYSKRPQTPNNYKEFLDPRIHLCPVKSWNGKSIFNLINNIKVINELRQIEKAIQPDIIHLHSSIAGGFGRLAFSNKKNVVYTPHGYAFILMGSGLKSKFYYFVEKILGKRDCITLTCCESENDVAKTLCNKTCYIETGLNIKSLANSITGIKSERKDKFTVFTLGRACVQKQPSLFNRIAQLVPEARFVWIGSGELENALTDCEVTGWKSRNEALSIAMNADAFILCSLGEAIAMSLLENMYLKKLILVSNTMGNKSVIKDGVNGYLCENAEDYANKLRAAIKNFPSELPQRARQDIEDRYNSGVMKCKFIAFYNKLLEV